MSFEYSIFTGGPNGQIQTKKVARTPKADDVVIKVTHSGLCYTDVHVKHREIALGHEGAGVVIEVGPAVKRLKVGDRVGFGILRGVCGHCRECFDGEDMYCADADLYSYPTGSNDIGSIASHAVIGESFAFKIPDAIPSTDAGPFMCAGASCFEPLLRLGARAGDRVGILGIGGLGHMGIQFANKMGFHVVVFSTTDAKRDEAFKLGAHEFVTFKGKTKFEGVEPIKHLLVVSSQQPDWRLFMPIMAPRSSIYPLTVDGDNTINVPLAAVIHKGIRVQGTDVAPRSVYGPMLQFAAAHGIKPMIKEFPMTESGIMDAFKELEAGKLRYRAVLVAQD